MQTTHETQRAVIHAGQWLSLKSMGERLGVSANSARKVARAGLVGSVLIPGLKYRRYRAADVDRLAAAAVTPANPGPAASPDSEGAAR